MRTRTQNTRALRAPWPLSLLALLLAATSCQDADTSSTLPPSASAARFKATVTADRYTGTVTDTFQLRPVLDGTLVGDLVYSWDLADAGTAASEFVQVSFSTPGSRSVTVVVTETTGEMRSARGSTLLTVLDPNNVVGLFGEPLAQFPGDIDRDGEITLADGMLLSQHLSGLRRIVDTDVLQAADFDRNGKIDAVDRDLVSRAVIEGGRVPELALPGTAMPGAVVQVFSPVLLDVGTHFQVQVGASPRFEPIRLVPGQVSFFLPLDVLTPGAFTTMGGTTEIALIGDGTIRATIPFTIEAPPPLSSNPLLEVDQLLAALPQLRAGIFADLTTLFAHEDAAELGFLPSDGEIVRGIFDEVTRRLDAADNTLRSALGTLGTVERQAVVRLAYANGLGQALSLIQGLQAMEAPLGADVVTLLCRIEDSAAALKSSTEVVGVACAGLGGLFLASLAAGTLFPGALILSAAALTAFEGCASALGVAELGQMVLDLVPDLGDELDLVPDGSTILMPGATLYITPRMRIVGLDTLCQQGGGAGASKGFEEWIAEPLTKALLRKFPLRPIYDLVYRLSPQAAEDLEEVVEDAVEQILGVTPLASYVESLIERLCGFFLGNVGVSVPVAPAIVELSANPAEGTIGVAGEQLTYTCPTTPSPSGGSILLTGVLPLCNGDARGYLPVTCGDEVDVTIRMGDNGSLLDDIFEVVVNGQTVLTSAVPVVSTQTTIALPSGIHVLQMRGLAAPDGIGTYYIVVSGAILTNGPPTSGSNLVPGVVFTWNLIVP